MSFVPFSTSYAAVVPGVPYRAIFPNGAPFIPTSRDGASLASIKKHVEAMLTLQQRGAVVFDNGNLIRTQAKSAGVANAFDIPIFTEAFLRPLFWAYRTKKEPRIAVSLMLQGFKRGQRL